MLRVLGKQRRPALESWRVFLHWLLSWDSQRPKPQYSGKGRSDTEKHDSWEKHEDQIQEVIPEPGIEPLLDKVDGRQLLFPEIIEREAPQRPVATKGIAHHPDYKDSFNGTDNK